MVNYLVMLFILWLFGMFIGHSLVCIMLFVNKLFERWWNRKNDKSGIFGDN